MEAALALMPSRRDAYLDIACDGDLELRREVASLIEAHERSGVVDRLAADLAPLAARVRETTALGTGALQAMDSAEGRPARSGTHDDPRLQRADAHRFKLSG